MAKKEDLSPSSPPPPPLPPEARVAASKDVGPRGFYWLKPGSLGGLPRPGIVQSLERDLEGLRRLGVTHLVTLEEELTVPRQALVEHELSGRHFPIVDMCAPDARAAQLFCADVEALIESGAIVALHCRAGLGRTGTMLSCQLVWEGVAAHEALAFARGINPRWVQSDEQIQFLSRFDELVNGAPREKRPPSPLEA
jgi:atypical dual specificity phosphatase